MSRNPFNMGHYGVHNKARQDHLASLGLPIEGMTVLEVGAGIGHHTKFFLDRKCRVTSTEARPDNVLLLRQRFPQIRVLPLDLDYPGDTLRDEKFDIVYCYGTLYHLSRPTVAIAFMANVCDKILLLETCVSRGDGFEINNVRENGRALDQSFHGCGCRPTRPWVRAELLKHFDHVYCPTTQPAHHEFPLCWAPEIVSEPGILTRAVFVASRKALRLPILAEELPEAYRVYANE